MTYGVKFVLITIFVSLYDKNKSFTLQVDLVTDKSICTNYMTLFSAYGHKSNCKYLLDMFAFLYFRAIKLSL